MPSASAASGFSLPLGDAAGLTGCSPVGWPVTSILGTGYANVQLIFWMVKSIPLPAKEPRLAIDLSP
jgi:hypothetical protein